MTNWQPTEDELKWLAEWVGLRYEKRRVREIVSGGWRDFECWVDDRIDPIKDMRSNWYWSFDPLNNWNHLRLVMEALAKNQGWWSLFRCLSSLSADKVDFDFPEAVIKMALALRKDGE